MSDNHRLCSSRVKGEVHHVNELSDNIGALYQNDEYSDVTLIVENERFKGHKVILAARSEYFRALLYGGLKESQQSEIELKEASLEAFRVLLKYIYTGIMNLSNLKEDVILDILSLAHQYVFEDLENSISDYLKAILNIKNVCLIYDMANFYQLHSLVYVCCCYMDHHAFEILNHDSFRTLSVDAMKEIINRDSFCAPEVDIFRAVCDWAKQNPEFNPEPVLKAIRLPLMTTQDLLKVVRPTKLIPSDDILDAIETQSERELELKYRGRLVPEENVASLKYSAQVLQGEMKSAVLDGDVQYYDMERGFTRHPIDDNNGQGILIKLGMDYIVNYMRLLLWDKDMRAYSYYIEVSMDQKDWFKVIDHSKYLCRSWQNVYFPARVVKFIRIVGTHNTVNRIFHLVSFEAMYTNRVYHLEQNLIVPKENIATVASSASVIEGVSRNRNALLNGDIKNYDWDSGYTCHQLGSGAIVIQLAQPYVVGSLRLLLWDCDERSYSYYIEVSTDQIKWELVADKTKEICRSWQTIKFKRRPVTFIKIVGTRNTANEVFHCVHFECPAKSDCDKNTGIESLSLRASNVLPCIQPGESESAMQQKQLEANDQNVVIKLLDDDNQDLSD